MEKGAPLQVSQAARIVALLLVLSTAIVRLLIAIAIQRGSWLTAVELLASVALGFTYLRGFPWAKNGLIGLVLFNLVYFALRGLILGEVVLALYEAVTSVVVLGALIGHPSRLRAASCLSIYGLLVAGVIGLLAFAAYRHHPVDDVMSTTAAASQYQSDYLYEVSFQNLPWRMMTPDQAERILGARVDEADLRLIREDGSSFALFFPLRFNNIRFSRELSVELEAEIEDRWLTDLHSWQRVPYEDGFLLTANGEVEQTPLSYIIFYKHFGNFGLYAVFWSEAHQHHQLISEAQNFYEQVTAPPLKQRLPTFTAAQIYQLNSSAVVLVNVYDAQGELVGRGSGFNLAPTGLVITNFHVLEHGKTAEIIFPKDGTYREIAIMGISGAEADLALLALNGAALPTVHSVQTVPAAPGDPVYVIGNPKGLVNSVSEGIIGGVRKEHNLTFYQITAPISRGSSGGPVFNQFGEVIGVASALIEGGQNLNFSIAIDELRQLFIFPQPLGIEEFNSLLEENSPSD